MSRVEMLYRRLEAIPEVELVRAGELTELEIPAGAERRILVLHGEAATTPLRITLGEGARLQLTEIFCEGGGVEAHISQASGSESEITQVLLGKAQSQVTIELREPHAESRLRGLFLLAAGEESGVQITTRHLAPECRSTTLVKGVASGEGANGRFEGLVYVAPDAQQTDARQTNRNIELTPGAKIRTLPQLEIYADDVKCSHGATVGQLDGEAILYMRQRGLSESQARHLQIEGFAGEVVMEHPCEALIEELRALVEEKLETM